MSLKDVLELIISDKSYLGKNFDEINICGKWFFDNNEENINIGIKFDEYN